METKLIPPLDDDDYPDEIGQPQTQLEVEQKDIEWLSGWLEGEGSFGIDKDKRHEGRFRSPRIQSGSDDKDVVEEAARILGVNCLGPYRNKGRDVEHYSMCLTGRRAYEWMKLLLPYMRGMRRASRINELLQDFKAKYDRG